MGEWYIQNCRLFYLWERINVCVDMFGTPHHVASLVVAGEIYIPLICVKKSEYNHVYAEDYNSVLTLN